MQLVCGKRWIWTDNSCPVFVFTLKSINLPLLCMNHNHLPLAIILVLVFLQFYFWCLIIVYTLPLLSPRFLLWLCLQFYTMFIIHINDLEKSDCWFIIRRAATPIKKRNKKLVSTPGVQRGSFDFWGFKLRNNQGAFGVKHVVINFQNKFSLKGGIRNNIKSSWHTTIVQYNVKTFKWRKLIPLSEVVRTERICWQI